MVSAESHLCHLRPCQLGPLARHKLFWSISQSSQTCIPQQHICLLLLQVMHVHLLTMSLPILLAYLCTESMLRPTWLTRSGCHHLWKKKARFINFNTTSHSASLALVIFLLSTYYQWECKAERLPLEEVSLICDLV